jgi:hypothetical protein
MVFSEPKVEQHDVVLGSLELGGRGGAARNRHDV